MQSTRRFPPPWSVEESSACFIVRDGDKQALAYVYFENEPVGRHTLSGAMICDHLRRRVRHAMVGFHHADDADCERAANDKECEIPGHCRFLPRLHAGSDSCYSPVREMKCGAAGAPDEIPMSSRALSSKPSKCLHPVSCRLMSAQRKPLWV